MRVVDGLFRWWYGCCRWRLVENAVKGRRAQTLPLRNRAYATTLVGSVVLLSACGSDPALEPIGTIRFIANDSVPIDLFDPLASDNEGSVVEWEEVQLLAADSLAVIFAAGDGSCGDPLSTQVLETVTTVRIGVRARDAECVGPGTFKAVQVLLESPLGDRTVLNERCHGEETAQPCGPVDELSGARLNREGYVSYLDP